MSSTTLLIRTSKRNDLRLLALVVLVVTVSLAVIYFLVCQLRKRKPSYPPDSATIILNQNLANRACSSSDDVIRTNAVIAAVQYPYNFIKITINLRTRQLSWCYAGKDGQPVPDGGRQMLIPPYLEYVQRAISEAPDTLFPMTTNDDYTFLLCVYDGIRERIAFNNASVPNELVITDNRFGGKLELDCAPDVYPVFPYPVFAYCAHRNDGTVRLAPDIYIQRDDGIRRLQESMNNDCAGVPTNYDQRIDKVVFRGGMNGPQRHALFAWAAQHEKEYAHLVDIRPNDPKTRGEMSRYKIQLDVDGETNSWDARWKYLTGSPVIKLSTHWKQWYYEEMIPNYHYVMINSLDDLPKTTERLLNDPITAQRIGQQGQAYVCSRFTPSRCLLETAEIFLSACYTAQRVLDVPQFSSLPTFADQFFTYLYMRMLHKKHAFGVVFASDWIGKVLFCDAQQFVPLPSILHCNDTHIHNHQ